VLCEIGLLKVQKSFTENEYNPTLNEKIYIQ
jgi:hypothetical protein